MEEIFIENERIRENFRKLRRNANLSQAEVAEKIGITLSTYKHLESRGGTDIIHRGVEKLPGLFGVSPEALFCRELTSDDLLLCEEAGEYGQLSLWEELLKLGNDLVGKGEEMSRIGKALLNKLEILGLK